MNLHMLSCSIHCCRASYTATKIHLPWLPTESLQVALEVVISWLSITSLQHTLLARPAPGEAVRKGCGMPGAGCGRPPSAVRAASSASRSGTPASSAPVSIARSTGSNASPGAAIHAACPKFNPPLLSAHAEPPCSKRSCACLAPSGSPPATIARDRETTANVPVGRGALGCL